MNKTGKGGFKKGNKGRPVGSINETRKRFNELVDKQGLLDIAIKVLGETLRDKKQRIVAAEIIIEQRIGKAPQSHDIQANIDGKIEIVLNTPRPKGKI